MKLHWKKNMCMVVLALMLALPALLVDSGRPAHADPAFTPMGDKMGINLPGMLEFVDTVKSAKRFGPALGQTAEPLVDAQGWPLADAHFTVHDYGPIGHQDPEKRQLDGSGTYKLSFNGQADLTVAGDPNSFSIQNKSYDAVTNTTTADLVVPSGKPVMGLYLSNTKRLPTDSINTGFTNMKLTMPGYASRPNQLFTDRFLDAIAPFSTIRTMDAMSMNQFNQFGGQLGDGLTYEKGAVTEWSDRKPPDFATQGNKDGEVYRKVKGIAWEYLLALANETEKDLWINIPISATDDYIEELANLFKNGPNGNDGLHSGLHLYVEYSNEVWNYAWPQYKYNESAAQHEMLDPNSFLRLGCDPESNCNNKVVRRRYAQRTVEIGQIFEQKFGVGSLNTTIRPVLAWQFAEKDLFIDMLDWISIVYGTPNQHIYGISAGTYMDLKGSPSDATPVEIVQQLWEQSDINFFRKQDLIAVANLYNIKMLGYEGGVSIRGSTDNIGNKILANRDPLMGNLIVHDLRDGWFDLGGDLFMYYYLYGYYSDKGTWGLTDLISDLDTVKYNAVLNLIDGTAPPANSNVPPEQYVTTADSSRPELLYGAVIGSWAPTVNLKAFDRDTSTEFYPGNTYGWVGLDLGAGNAQLLTKIRINRGQYPARSKGDIEGSNDGENWTFIYKIPFKGIANTWDEYIINNPTTAYRYYRFRGYLYPTQFRELELYRPAQSLLVYDDFEDGNADGWTKQAEAGGPLDSGWSVVMDGSYQLQDENNKTSESYAVTGVSSWTNYSIEADVTPLVNNGPFYLVGRLAHDGPGGIGGHLVSYQFGYNNTRWQIDKHAGTWSTIGYSSTMSITANQTYHLKAVLDGDQLSFYVDGVLVASTTDSTLTNGRVGFVTNNYSGKTGTKVEFDNFKVAELP